MKQAAQTLNDQADYCFRSCDWANFAVYARRSAMLNDITGIVNHAIALCHGIGTPANPYNAVFLFNKAISMGSAVAAHALGRMYDFGIGIKPDIVVAIHNYTKASSAGIVDASLALATIYHRGTRIEADIYKAAEYYRLIISRNVADREKFIMVLYNFAILIHDNMDAFHKTEMLYLFGSKHPDFLNFIYGWDDPDVLAFSAKIKGKPEITPKERVKYRLIFEQSAIVRPIHILRRENKSENESDNE